MRARIIASKAVIAAVVVGGLAVPALNGAAHAAAAQPKIGSAATRTVAFAGAGFTAHHGRNGEVDVNACSTATAPGHAHCNARVRVDDGVVATAANARRNAHTNTVQAPGQAGGPYDPSFLQSAYNAPSATRGTGQTVAIVDAYDNPNAESDLAVYRANYGLPACTTANGCFRKIDENGGTSYPAQSTGWGLEISLDVDMVSALCPNCHILLVEANSSSLLDLGAAVNTAVAQGATEVSNSYGGVEFSSEASVASLYYDHPGVPITVSSGDNGYGVEFPAAAPEVVSVGGTALMQTTNGGTRNATEKAWNGTGSGCSKYVPKQSWQTDSCARRTSVDVSADADPNTGAWVYDTFGGYDFAQVGGTSESAPIIAAMFALAAPAASQPASYLYSHASNFNDITTGSNGGCGSYLCNAGPGYDGPTGLGTPKGVSGLGANVGGPKDFDTTVAPSNTTMPNGAATSATVNVSPMGAFNGAVTLSASVSPSTGLTANLETTAMNVGPNSNTATLDFNAAAPGMYTVTITVNSTVGGLSHQIETNVSVTGADFALKGPTKGRKVTAGKKTSVRVSVKPLAGFTGAVTFSLTGLPAGDSYTLSRPQVDIKGAETFTITTSLNDPRGVPFPLTITATSGTIVRTLSFTLTLK